MREPQSCSWTWRNILKLRETFLPYIQCNYAVIKGLSFWNSPWAKPGLNLSSIVDYNLRRSSGISEDAMVEEYIHDGAIVLPFSSSFQLWSLWNTITNSQLTNSDNALIWSTKLNCHSIKLVYQLFCKSDTVFPWCTRIWNNGCSAKHNLLLWKVMANALNTKDKLCRLGIISEDLCVLCNSESETNTHLFFECSFVYQIWYRLLSNGGFYKPSNVSSIE